MQQRFFLATASILPLFLLSISMMLPLVVVDKRLSAEQAFVGEAKLWWRTETYYHGNEELETEYHYYRDTCETETGYNLIQFCDRIIISQVLLVSAIAVTALAGIVSIKCYTEESTWHVKWIPIALLGIGGVLVSCTWIEWSTIISNYKTLTEADLTQSTGYSHNVDTKLSYGYSFVVIANILIIATTIAGATIKDRKPKPKKPMVLEVL